MSSLAAGYATHRKWTGRHGGPERQVPTVLKTCARGWREPRDQPLHVHGFDAGGYVQRGGQFGRCRWKAGRASPAENRMWTTTAGERVVRQSSERLAYDIRRAAKGHRDHQRLLWRRHAHHGPQLHRYRVTRPVKRLRAFHAREPPYRRDVRGSGSSGLRCLSTRPFRMGSMVAPCAMRRSR
jgi:hypothetical protein